MGPTMYFPEVPQCTLVLPTECRKKSLPSPHLPRKSRLLLHQRGNTLYGLEVLFLLHFPPSNRCGSQSKNTTKPVHPLSTGSASKYFNKVTKQSKKENKKSPRHKKISLFRHLFVIVLL